MIGDFNQGNLVMLLITLEKSINGGFSQFESCGGSSYKELKLLSRHNQVFGLQDVVKKVAGLGGWHWPVLKVLFEASKFSKLTSLMSNPFHNKHCKICRLENKKEIEEQEKN
ncbi:hypothetical protein GIB67_031480 [Kingdonia uniflora]|uniref:Uncharacterized protein n=1 Tax=Kingdonia uniflora TaxID=39325 RepID=A0A7J7MN36_9MAGN|nr:hypothetical protein GIB67_031480 [Kingdonia uniflora]